MKKRLSVLLLSVGLVVGAAAPAFAHGGSVIPPGTDVCRDLNLHQKGNGSAAAAEGGLATASISGVVAWIHCDDR